MKLKYVNVKYVVVCILKTFELLDCAVIRAKTNCSSVFFITGFNLKV